MAEVKRRKRKKYRKRRKRVLRAYFFRFLFICMILLAGIGIFFGWKMAGKGLDWMIKDVSALWGNQKETQPSNALYERDENGNLLVDMDKKGKLLLPEDKLGRTVLPTDASGEAMLKLDSEGKLLLPTDEDGNSIVPDDPEGNPLYSINEKGKLVISMAGVEPKVAETDAEGNTIVETEAPAEPHEKTFTLTATGDCTLAKTQTQGYEESFYEYYDDYGADYFFAGVRDIFEKDDLTLLNLECVLTDSDNREDKTFNLKGKPEYISILTGSSVEGVYLGNNHIDDYGDEGISDTKSILDQAGIEWALNDDLGYYTTDDGIKVGYVSVMNIVYTEEREQRMIDGIKMLREQGCDIVIACIHWGVEKATSPEYEQVQEAHHFIDAGADIVIGNHPHVLQGVEVYNGKVICYSLGNFCFGGNRDPSDKDTMIFQQTWTWIDGELQADINASIIPCKISSTNSYNDFQPTVATESKQRIIDKVNGYNAEFGSARFDSDGVLQVNNSQTETAEEDE